MKEEFWFRDVDRFKYMWPWPLSPSSYQWHMNPFFNLHIYVTLTFDSKVISVIWVVRSDLHGICNHHAQYKQMKEEFALRAKPTDGATDGQRGRWKDERTEVRTGWTGYNISNIFYKKCGCNYSCLFHMLPMANLKKSEMRFYIRIVVYNSERSYFINNITSKTYRSSKNTYN